MGSLIVLLILILIGAMFPAMEMAFISLNDAKIAKMAKDGNKRAAKVNKILKHPSKFLATLQIGNTLAGFLCSAFAADAFSGSSAAFFHDFIPIISLEVWKTISIVAITLVLSYFTILFGELIPKRLAMKYHDKIAFAGVGIIKVMYLVTGPFAKLLSVSTNLVSKLFGVSEQDEAIVTEEEIRMMVDVGQEKGSIQNEEKEMIENVFEFNDKLVSDIMIHRTDIYAVSVEATTSDFLADLKGLQYSRIPVYEETIDDIVGMLYIKDLLEYFDIAGAVKIRDLVRPAYFVSENKMINELFRELQKNKHQIAVVLDEYGGTAGIVTMEDILEEIVGNIFDEYDEVENEYEKIDENTYMISGGVTINELKKILNTEIPEGEYDTLSGYLVDLLGRIPRDDEKPEIETERVTYKIEEYEDKRIVWVKACKKDIPEELEEDDDEEEEER